MLKYLTNKLRNHSLNEENAEEKIDGHDSGTESDDEIDRPEMLVIESARPMDSALRDQQYDHHSSEEELEVINSTPKQCDKFVRPYPSSAPCATSVDMEPDAIGISDILLQRNISQDDAAAAADISATGAGSPSTLAAAQTLTASASTPELLLHSVANTETAKQLPLGAMLDHRKFAIDANVQSSSLAKSKQDERQPVINRLRCASAAAALPLPEKRKWSRVGPAYCHARKSDSSHSQSTSRGPSSDPASSDDYDDDLDFEDLLLFSPPPYGSQAAYLSGLDSPGGDSGGAFRGYSAPVRFRTSPPLEALKPGAAQVMVVSTKVCRGDGESSGVDAKLVKRDSPVRRDSDEAKTGSGIDWSIDTPMEIRSLSPPTKVFHCSVSPKRRSARPSSSHQSRGHRHTHRPCLDFDKMQQLKARSVPAWRHSGERGGDLSVFCW